MFNDARWGAALALALVCATPLVLSTPAHAETTPLRYRSRGAAVTDLQKALRERGFLWSKPTGVYDSRTRFAVWAFQKSRGMRPQTLVGPATLRALSRPSKRPPLPKSLRTGAVIDLRRQLLTVYRDHRKVMTVHVSTGAHSRYCHSGRCAIAITPVGDFRITKRTPGWTTGPLGSMYNSLYFVGGVAIHGSSQVPRRPASHGCVRVPLRAADRLFELLDVGDPVHVRRST
ncbi:L,D-transpeptidase family protein [Nonomuraea africana]|uniref:Lipoprotein-anchoring transpeptidase ErfK/SrfK n=1 Tax=Nonomuraea africana TaxID=46171 RepID=A0ABR9KC20_9ACTN|nr:L,D-transpeptidase family protein [Nonomuraea africana]MBE1559480.1 lipoprotein-anchoring transpeptidase ErfK/SrfK [Nonomuraea africana]